MTVAVQCGAAYRVRFDGTYRIIKLGWHVLYPVQRSVPLRNRTVWPTRGELVVLCWIRPRSGRRVSVGSPPARRAWPLTSPGRPRRVDIRDIRGVRADARGTLRPTVRSGSKWMGFTKRAALLSCDCAGTRVGGRWSSACTGRSGRSGRGEWRTDDQVVV